MNFKFIFPPTMLMLLLTYAFFQFPRLGDFDFHSEYKGGGIYPSGVAFAVNLMPLPQGLAIFIFGLLVCVVLPYILIFEITKKEKASWVYLYGSNVATILLSLYFIPQATIQVFMLASVLFPPFLVIFALIGGFFHNQYLFAVILTWLYIMFKRRAVI